MTNRNCRFGQALLVVALLFAMPESSTAQSRAGTTAAPFLTIGTGAKGSAMGHGYTASARGGDALFWNPAGAARPYLGEYRGEAFFTRHQLFAEIDYNALAVVVPINSSAVVGISIGAVDYGRMTVRTVDFPEGTGETFSASDLVFGLTYAQPLTQSFYFGGTAKYVQQRIRDNSSSAVAFDFGFVLETAYLNGLKVAASIQNFGGTMKIDGINSQVFVDVDPGNTGNNDRVPALLETSEWDLPLSFKFGVELPIIKAGNLELIAVGDANQTNDNDLNADVGGQLRFGTKTFNFDMRAGYRDLGVENVDAHLSYGAGLDVRVTAVRFGFDFAYVPFDLLGNVPIVDFRVYF